MFNERCYDMDNDMSANFIGDNNVINMENEMNISAGPMMNPGNMPMMNPGSMQMGGCVMRPVCEPVQERCVHKTIMHEVPQE